MTTSRGSNISSRIEGGTLVVEVSGLVTLETLREVRRETFRRVVMSDQIRRRLLDFTLAVITLSGTEWNDLAMEQLSAHLLAVPTAVLVAASTLAEAWRYCDRMNAAGRAYVAFKNAADAYLWANVSVQAPRPSRRGRAKSPAAGEPLSPPAPRAK